MLTFAQFGGVMLGMLGCFLMGVYVAVNHERTNRKVS